MARNGQLHRVPLDVLLPNLLIQKDGNEKNILEIGMGFPPRMDFLLGLDLPSACEKYVSSSWWKTHLTMLSSKHALCLDVEPENSIDLF